MSEEIAMTADEEQLLELYRQMPLSDRQIVLLLFKRLTMNQSEVSTYGSVFNYGKIGCVGSVTNSEFK